MIVVLGVGFFVVIAGVIFLANLGAKSIEQVRRQRDDDFDDFHRNLDRERVARDRGFQARDVKIAVLEADVRAAQDIATTSTNRINELVPVRAELLTLVGNLNEQILHLDSLTTGHLDRLRFRVDGIATTTEQFRSEIRQFIDEMTRLAAQSRQDYETLLTESEGIIRFLSEVPQNFGLHLPAERFHMLMPDRLKMSIE